MHIAGQCRNSEADVARLNLDGCLDDEMLLIVDVFQGVWSSPQSGGDGQGRSEARRPRQRRRVCRYSSGDCVEPMSSRLFSRLSNSCVGRSSCSFDVDVGWLRSCNRRADYIQVTYQCIPRSFCFHTILSPNSITPTFTETPRESFGESLRRGS